jgi:hypothetical protein
MDMTIDEALEWLKEEFKVSVNKTTISRIFSLYQVTHKRLKFVAAQRNPQLDQKRLGKYHCGKGWGDV